MNVLRISETINGRPCVIEVLAVGPQRWRAQLSRKDGTTALMPFYGITPEEAAQLLIRWLERAGVGRPVNPVTGDVTIEVPGALERRGFR